jgi:hypothetical protein
MEFMAVFMITQTQTLETCTRLGEPRFPYDPS